MKIKPRMEQKPNHNFVPPSSVHRDGGVSISDRENLKAIIDGLRCSAGDPMPCAKCRYRAYIYDVCKCKCAEDAIALLKEQEPRVLTLEKLMGIYNLRENHSWVYNTPPYLYMDYGKDTGYWIAWSNIVSCLERCYPKYIPEDYGKTWRCWTAKPTSEQREGVKWGD